MPMLASNAGWKAIPAEMGTRVVVSRPPQAPDTEVLRASVAVFEAGQAALLVDVSHLPVKDATTGTLHRVARCLGETVPVTAGLVAVVGRSPNAYSVARSLQSYAESSGVFARSFDDDALACDWLRTVSAALADRRFA